MVDIFECVCVSVPQQWGCSSEQRVMNARRRCREKALSERG